VPAPLGERDRQDLRRLRDQVGREVKEWTLEEVVGQFTLAAEKSTALAYKGKDPGLAWTIQRDLARLLREFGLVGEQDQSGFAVTLTAIGEGYQRATAALSRALDPRLTGEVVEAEASPSRLLTIPEPVKDPRPEPETPGQEGPEQSP